MGPWLVEVGARQEIFRWLAADPPVGECSIRMIVRGDGPVVRAFLPRALEAAKTDPRRVVVWVRDETLLTDAECAALFNGSPEILASVICEGRTRGWVSRDAAGAADARFAFDFD